MPPSDDDNALSGDEDDRKSPWLFPFHQPTTQNSSATHPEFHNSVTDEMDN